VSCLAIDEHLLAAPKRCSQKAGGEHFCDLADVSLSVYWRLTAAWHRFANTGRLLSIHWRNSFEQSIGTRFEVLRKPCEGNHSEGILAPLDVADGLCVDAHQLCETFLRQIRPQTGGSHVTADDAKEVLVGHSRLWSV
jgi:hypothetical protein